MSGRHLGVMASNSWVWSSGVKLVGRYWTEIRVQRNYWNHESEEMKLQKNKSDQEQIPENPYVWG